VFIAYPHTAAFVWLLDRQLLQDRGQLFWVGFVRVCKCDSKVGFVVICEEREREEERERGREEEGGGLSLCPVLSPL
jgi:hypothetical protein